LLTQSQKKKSSDKKVEAKGNDEDSEE